MHRLPMANNEMELRGKIRELTRDLGEQRELSTSLLQNHVAEYVPPSVSTGITWLTAAIAGAANGAMGPRNSIGPVRVDALAGIGFMVAGLLVEEPNAKEALQAAARGIGAPVAADLGYRASLGYFHPEILTMLEETDAASAAITAGGSASKADKKPAKV